MYYKYYNFWVQNCTISIPIQKFPSNYQHFWTRSFPNSHFFPPWIHMTNYTIAYLINYDIKEQISNSSLQMYTQYK